MEKLKNNLLEENDAVAIIVGFIIGTGILALPNAVAQDAKQDAWISVIIGGVYPIYLSLLSIYYVKKHPNEDILILSKKYLGNILGTICNALFMAQFGIYIIFTAASLSNVYRVYATPFLTQIKIVIPALLLAVYLGNKGILVLGTINKIALYFVLFLMLIQIGFLGYGNYLNLLPVFGTGYKNILKSSMQCALSYAGMEAIFLLYPILREKSKILKVTFKASFIAITTYTLVTFMSIYCLGYKVTSKILWPVLLVAESIELPVLNSFSFAFLFLWSFVLFKAIANEHYAFSYILTNLIKIKNISIIYYFTVPLAIYLCSKLDNEVLKRDYANYIIPKVTIFNIAYISIIGLLIFIDDKKTSNF